MSLETSDLLTLLAQVTARTLEEAAFVFLEPADPAPPWGDEPVVESRISFSGASSGELQLRASGRLATSLAANLLGLEPEDAAVSPQRLDAVGEMLNMIGGVLIHELAPAGGIELGLPRVALVEPGPEDSPSVRPGGEDAGPAAAVTACSFVTDEGERLDAVAVPS